MDIRIIICAFCAMLNVQLLLYFYAFIKFYGPLYYSKQDRETNVLLTLSKDLLQRKRQWMMKYTSWLFINGNLYEDTQNDENKIY